ncbi:MAG: sulfatase [Deltaproteobacteria bacterium]|nr:MAG: sulfatase [Deltaproteobacteria bacterium]
MTRFEGSRRNPARCVPVLCLVLCLLACREAEVPRGATAAAGAPNIVLVVVDTLRADHLSLYGYPRATSPHLDRIAQRAAVFDRAYSVISHTLPAHVSLMTGIHPTGHQVLSNGWRYEGPFPTLAERLREAGYATAGFVSGLPLDAESGMARGFEVYRDTRDWRGRRRGKIPGTDVTRAAQRWLADTARAPFFLFLHYYDVHPPYLRAEGAEFPFQVDATLRSVVDARGVADAAMESISYAPVTLDDRPLGLVEAINTYDNEIHHVDAMIQELIDALAERGALDSTWLVVTSDHGEGLGEHGYYQHGLYLYEEQLHVPLLVRNFGDAGPGRRVAVPVTLLDVCATLAEVAGLSPDPRLQGASLLAVMRGAAEPAERWLLAQRRFFSQDVALQRGRFAARDPLFAVLGTGPAKLVWSGAGPPELYDLSADPRESENLASARPEELQRLLDVLHELRRRYATDAPMPDTSVEPELREQLEALGYLP